MTSESPCSSTSSSVDSTLDGSPAYWPMVTTAEQSWQRVSRSIDQLVSIDRSSDSNDSKTVETHGTRAVSEVVPRPATDADRRMAALRQHGDFTLAYNTAVQEGLEYFQTSDGYLAFRCFKGHVFVLGDPVASPAGMPELLRDFIRQYPKPTFAQISSATAAELERLGYYINEMGVDTVLDLSQYSFAGKSMERIRYAGNWLKKHGYTIEEADYTAASQQEARAVSEGWRAGMNCRKAEMRFLNRPICYHDELDVRKFFLRDSAGKLVAFFYFDPLYGAGKILGYATAIKRRLPEAPIYAEQGLMRAAVEKFQSEGLQRVHLGLSPMAGIENKSFRCNPFLHYSFRYAFSAWWVNRFFYNLQGHAQYKRHFKGREVPYHYASPVLFNDLRIYNLMRLTGVC
ncbi:MAG: DUF2156 domain-containing protein [Planctomycetaceae bacterium]|nr:DUF2156 domain-containing protein [Planctomycetaceae bacterium]